MRSLPSRYRRLALATLFIVLLLVACSQPPAETPEPDDADRRPQLTREAIPTLYPTFTRPSATETATAVPQDTPTPRSTIDFEQPVVEFRYRIPALQLDRRLEANVNGEITVVDETVGLASMRQNQGGILLELQDALPELELEPVPANCDSCVAFSYSLPIDGVSDEGWLQDPVMLASVENYTSVAVGTHFPPDTVLGLRRSATAYDVAHSLALTSEGQLWRWLATEAQVAAPVPIEEAGPQLASLLAELPLQSLTERYIVQCPGAPAETLFLNPTDAEEGFTIEIGCPAFSLSRPLLPLYLEMDRLLQEVVPEEEPLRPPLEIPLATVVDYQRDDGARLSVLLDGTARATKPAGETVTMTLTSSQVLSVTAALVESDVLQPGLDAYVADDAPNILLVRSLRGMAEVAWTEDDGPPEGALPQIRFLNSLLDELLAESEETGESIRPQPSPTPSPAATATP